MKTKKSQGNRFYCARKRCRKTAWETPEYLTQADWKFLKSLLPDIQCLNPAALWQTLWFHHNFLLTRDFFDRVMGWPEGYVYCQDFNYFKIAGVLVFQKNFHKLKESLDKKYKNVGFFLYESNDEGNLQVRWNITCPLQGTTGTCGKNK